MSHGNRIPSRSEGEDCLRMNRNVDAILLGGGPVASVDDYVGAGEALPKMLDFDDTTETFAYDERYRLKQPDWTYADG
jgi:hypothetical protein